MTSLHITFEVNCYLDILPFPWFEVINVVQILSACDLQDWSSQNVVKHQWVLKFEFKLVTYILLSS